MRPYIQYYEFIFSRKYFKYIISRLFILCV